MSQISPYECFSNIRQEFLICTTIHKAKNLSAFNADTYVKVTLDKKHRTTKVFQNSENPYYNQYFAFELVCTLAELLRLTVHYEVKKKVYCKKNTTLGELLIDLGTVWNQPGHNFFQKWGQLETNTTDVKGYLQVDLAIVSKHQAPHSAVFDGLDHDDVESNLLLPETPSQPILNVKYSVLLYSGVFNKKDDYLIQVFFAGMTGKSKLRKGTKCPDWNEQIEFVWFHPSLSQKFLIRVMSSDCCALKTVSECEIHSEDISFSSADIPSFGPTCIQLTHKSSVRNHFGHLLMEIRSEKMHFTNENINRSVVVGAAPILEDKAWWDMENFILECLIWQGDFLNINASNVKIVLKFGDLTTNTAEVILKSYEKVPDKKYFQEEPPYKAIHAEGLFPDNRLKFECDIFLHEIEIEMTTQLDNFKLFQLKHPGNELLQSKCLKAIIMSFQKLLQKGKNRIGYNGFKQLTNWDKTRLHHLKDFYERTLTKFEKLRQQLKIRLRYLRETFASVISELKETTQEINYLRNERRQDIWPELVLYMLSGSKEVAFCQLNAVDFMHSQRRECAGMFSRKRRNFVLKSMSCTHTCRNCGCVVGKLDGWIWIGTEAERNDLSNDDAWNCVEPFYYTPKETTSFTCRVYIHQAKVRPGSDKSGLCDARVRLTFRNLVADTSTVTASLSPVWDEIVTFEGLSVPGPPDLYTAQPPFVAVEVFDTDSLTADDYLGCGLVALAVKPCDGVLRQSKSQEFYEKVVDEQEVPPASPDKNAMHRIKSMRGDPSRGRLMNLRNIVKTKIAVMKLKEVGSLFPSPLKWVPIAINGSIRVEILISGELIKEGGSSGSESATVTKGIPPEICPVMKKYKFEAIFAGLRHCQKLPIFQLAGRYKVKVMLGDLVLFSGLSGSKMKQSINFLDIYASGVVFLPEQHEYWPPIIVTHIDVSRKNQELTLGAALIPHTVKFLTSGFVNCEPKDETILNVGSFDESSPLVEIETEKKKPSLLGSLLPPFHGGAKLGDTKVSSTYKPEEAEYTWWTKFYNSLHPNEKSEKHSLEVYNSELEKQPEFNAQQDWAEAVPIVHGLKQRKNCPPTEEVYCTLKARFKITECEKGTEGQENSHTCAVSKFQEMSKLSSEVKVLVRIYIVQGLQLISHERNAQSDAFVKLQLGSHKISDRAHYVPNQANPIFGKRFQMHAVIPRDHVLYISVYNKRADWDSLIGGTEIDLEDRYRSMHRATTGIANEYNRHGYNIWRDAFTPYEILKEICRKHDLGPPFFNGNTVEVGGVSFKDSTKISLDQDLHERLSLTALRRLEEVPGIGYKLVPEHVETRSLYRRDRPGIAQGKIQLWVEIYESENIPPPIDITPMPAQLYELRIVIYNTADVVLSEKNIFGKSMSDIYVKGWLQDNDEAQDTDVHYRSLTGEGNFNWRMIFPMKYSKSEDMMIIKRKGGILNEYEMKLPPIVYLQIWDNDAVSADDFLGACEINLSNFVEPSSSKKKCVLNARKGAKMINLFNQKTIRGWFACRGKAGLTGKIEAELQMLTETEAMSALVGLGRSPPNALPEPNRPDTSFNPFTNPLKAIKLILLPALKKAGLYCCLVIVVILLIFGLFSAFENVHDCYY